jgi:hypothetical protein
MTRLGVTFLAACLASSACGTDTATTTQSLPTTPEGTMQITSSAFFDNTPIPDRYT